MFQRALQALESDSSRATILVSVVGAALVAAWTSWLFCGSLPVYAVSTQARIEVVPGPFPVQAAVRGRLTAIHAEMGDEVAEGALLFELDSATEQLALKSAERRLSALRLELAPLRRKASAVSDATARQREAARVSGLQAEARLAEIKATEGYLEHSSRSVSTLAQMGAIAALEEKKASSELESIIAARRASQIEVVRKGLEMRLGNADRQADLADIEHEIAAREGLCAELEVSIEALEHDIARRTVRAPGAGRVGELAKLQLGAWVEAGDRLASIIPPGSFQIVAQLEPDAALGRIHANLPSRVHLDGFPWTQFGMIEGRVLRTGSEVRDGLIRVNLSIDRINPVIPLQHGLPGVAEILVEETTPAEQILRSLSRYP
ncbi:HlyD family secretion protein [Chondromyces apiculatus]|uniref:HlyD family secretion protein n=1 Tax=Chondromyces apiculatus DSM 436 TaxID=1192034 RepID=A0A017T7P0_9BACT|nr:HlyD family efflux transporter periplasmic adaptor subunit [Chondromyces apiculatus]EYF04576.1 HlyD family secretion protein [Chondromyces apiculatus DSM 436]